MVGPEHLLARVEEHLPGKVVERRGRSWKAVEGRRERPWEVRGRRKIVEGRAGWKRTGTQPTEMASMMPGRGSVSPGGCRQKSASEYRWIAFSAPLPDIEIHTHWHCVVSSALQALRSALRQATKPCASASTWPHDAAAYAMRSERLTEPVFAAASGVRAWLR